MAPDSDQQRGIRLDSPEYDGLDDDDQGDMLDETDDLDDDDNGKGQVDEDNPGDADEFDSDVVAQYAVALTTPTKAIPVPGLESRFDEDNLEDSLYLKIQRLSPDQLATLQTPLAQAQLSSRKGITEKALARAIKQSLHRRVVMQIVGYRLPVVDANMKWTGQVITYDASSGGDNAHNRRCYSLFTPAMLKYVLMWMNYVNGDDESEGLGFTA